MSLRELDYLSTKEGGKAFAVLFTAAQALANKTDVNTPEELDVLLRQVIAENKDLYNNEESKAQILFNAIDNVFFTTVVSQASLQAAIGNTDGTLDFIPTITGGLLQAAAHFNIVNETNENMKEGQKSLCKRDFLRLANLMYDMAFVQYRNIRMIRGDSPGKFQ